MMKRVRSQLAFCFALTLLLSSAHVAVGVSVLPIINRPHNDRCDQAESVGEVAGLYFDTTNATFDGPGLCMTSPNIWYCYTASCTGNVTVSLLGSSFDTGAAVTLNRMTWSSATMTPALTPHPKSLSLHWQGTST